MLISCGSLFVSNYEAGKFQFAFLAYHMLFMCYVYFEIWHIRENFKGDFEKAIIYLPTNQEKELLKATSPFVLKEIKEASIFRIFKLSGMNSSDIGRLKKSVMDRNNVAHSNGNIFYRSEKELELKIDEMLRCIELIQNQSKSILHSCIENFLIESFDPENREFIDNSDRVREVLVHQNYLSAADLKSIRQFDITQLSSDPSLKSINSLNDMEEILFDGDEVVI